MWRNQTSALAVLLLIGVVICPGCAEKESVEIQIAAVSAADSNVADLEVASEESTASVEQSNSQAESQARVEISEENEEEEASLPGTEEFGLTPRQLVQSI